MHCFWTLQACWKAKRNCNLAKNFWKSQLQLHKKKKCQLQLHEKLQLTTFNYNYNYNWSNSVHFHCYISLRCVRICLFVVNFGLYYSPPTKVCLARAFDETELDRAQQTGGLIGDDIFRNLKLNTVRCSRLIQTLNRNSSLQKCWTFAISNSTSGLDPRQRLQDASIQGKDYKMHPWRASHSLRQGRQLLPILHSSHSSPFLCHCLASVTVG